MGEVATGHRASLLEGAIACIETRGYARTTARAVVETSGTNLGSIAYHFGSIEELREEALLEAAGRWLGPVITAAKREESTVDSFSRSLEAFLRSLSARRGLVVAFLEALAQAERKDRLRDRLATAYDELRSTVESRADPGLASLVVAMFDGLMIQWLIDPGRFDDPAAFADEVAKALQALATASPG